MITINSIGQMIIERTTALLDSSISSNTVVYEYIKTLTGTPKIIYTIIPNIIIAIV
jgi:hypothetical protein